MKPTFDVCTTDVLDSMKLPTSALVLTVDRGSKFKQSDVLATSKMRPMHTKFERLLSKSLTTLEVVTYYLVVHTGPGLSLCLPGSPGQQDRPWLSVSFASTPPASHRSCQPLSLPGGRLVGLVVKASTSRAKGPGFESRLRRDFSGLSHTSDLKIGTPVATLPGAWRYRVSAGSG